MDDAYAVREGSSPFVVGQSWEVYEKVKGYNMLRFFSEEGARDFCSLMNREHRIRMLKEKGAKDEQ